MRYLDCLRYLGARNDSKAHRTQATLERDSSIEIPAGFYRHSASHIAVIRLDLEKPKLVAETFFKKTDLNYYLDNLIIENKEIDQIAMVLDFKNNKEYLVGKDRKPYEL